MSNFEAKIHFEQVKNNFKNLSQDPEHVNMQEIWKQNKQVEAQM